jgi:hypothetical protein
MFKIFAMRTKPKTTADEKLEQVINILFPPLDLHVDKNGDKFHIDYSVDTNLEAALMDLEDGHNDAASQKTIRNVTDRILKVRRLLEAYREIDDEAKYFIADDLEDNDIEQIQARQY